VSSEYTIGYRNHTWKFLIVEKLKDALEKLKDLGEKK
jgi:hypothetical protein